MYSIVEFSDGLYVVPSCWTVDNNACFWPEGYLETKINQMIEAEVNPEKSWPQLQILRIFGTSDSYSDAVDKMKLCMEISDIDSTQSEGENVRKKRKVVKNKHIANSDQDPEESSLRRIPEYPKQPKKKMCFKNNSSKAQVRFPAFSCKRKYLAVNGMSSKRQVKLSDISCKRKALVVNGMSSKTQVKLSDISCKRKALVVNGMSSKNDQLSDNETNEFVERGNTSNKAQVQNVPVCETDNLSLNRMLSVEGRGRNEIGERGFQFNSPLEHVSQKESDFSDKNFKELLLGKINFLILKVKSLDEKVGELTKLQNANNFTAASCDIAKEFPMANKKKLEDVELYLKDEENQKSLVFTLKGLGGVSVNHVITNILKKTITNELAELFSYAGAKEKLPFNVLNFCKVVLETTRMHFPSTTEIDFGKIVAKWLVHAKQRRQRAEGLM